MENQTIKGIYFSKREIEVISCLCSGCSTKIIARILKISICSVNSYIQRIMLKMNCCSRREIVKFVESSDEYTKIRDIYIEINFGFNSDNDISVGEVDFNTACKQGIIQYFFQNTTKSFVIFVSLIGFIGFGIFLCKNDKCISFEIPAVGKDVLLERKYIAEEISNEFSKTENVNCVALIGTGGIGKTTLAREYLRKSRFEVKAEIDAESEFKIIESLENLLFLLYKNDSEYKILQSIKGIKNIEEKRKKLSKAKTKNYSRNGVKKQRLIIL